MTIHYNRKSENVNRKKLRKSSTRAEDILWEYLRNRKFLKLKFKRQYSIDHFVTDFYCSELKLAIELDGEIHLDHNVKVHDENRDGFLSGFGIKILRIKNEMIINDPEKGLELIKGKIIEIKNTSPKSSPYKGEDF